MIIAVVGKGGVGKTTISALILRRLLEAGERPVLAIDADPSSCLAAALGLRVERTLGDLRDELRAGGPGGLTPQGGAAVKAAPDTGAKQKPGSMSSAEYLAVRAEEAMLESQGFDLLTMGHPEGHGCYCFVNNVVREHLGRLVGSYRHVLVDCEAGLEHISRRTVGRPDRLVCVCSRARMAAETIRRALGIFRALHGELPAGVDLVLNGFAPGEPAAAEAAALARGEGAPFTRTVFVPHDPALTEAERAGRSLLELADAAPAWRAVADWSLVP